MKYGQKGEGMFIVYRLTVIVMTVRTSFGKPVLSEPFILREPQDER
jgi:hypothetical protein